MFGVVVALALLGCGSKTESTKEGALDKGLCPKPGKMCNTFTCGGNSAIANAFPVNGWRADKCSPEGIKLVKSSLDGPCAGQTLDIKDGKLVGIKDDGTVGCSEAALKDASFEVGSHKGTERIKIADVLVSWKAPNGTERTAYKMEWVDGSNKHGLCSKDGQKLRKKLGIEPMYDSDDLPDPEAQLVIPIVSEIYDEEGFVADSDPWNHLACVDDALAKRSLYQLENPDAKKNRTALRMVTADYCGATAWTVRGEWIEWGHTNGTNVEAQWDDKGATCLTAPRLLRDDNDQVVEPSKKTEHLLKRLCKKSPSKCNKVEDWLTEMKTCRKNDGTVDHVLPDCSECTDPNTCPLSSKNAKHP